MKALRNVLTKLLNVLAGVSFIAMVVLTCWQVFTRYVLQDPSPWSEELVSYLFAWASLLGASLITGERGHMNIPIVAENARYSRRAGRLCFLRHHSGLWRRADLPACLGTDDLVARRRCRRILCRASPLRRVEHDLYRFEYCRYLQKRHRNKTGGSINYGY